MAGAMKACKACKFLHSSNSCPKCGSSDSSTSYKGKLIILDPDKSEIAKNLKIKEKGFYAIKT